jgi:hypothetical protein
MSYQKLTKINKVLSIDQSTYLKQYIDLNTKERAESKYTFEKD